MKSSRAAYLEILEKKLADRMKKNARYSLTAFARDIGLTVSSVSKLFQVKRGLSLVKAREIAERLRMDEEERAYFLCLVEAEHGKTQEQREKAQIRLRKFERTQHVLSVDLFHVISDWYHFGLLELLALDGFKNDPSWIADALQIEIKEARGAIERLKRLNLVRDESGTLVRCGDLVAVPGGRASEAGKKFHSQLLRLADQKLHTRPLEERDFETGLLRFRESDMERARVLIKDFQRTFMAEMESGSGHDRVFCFGMQFFELGRVDSQVSPGQRYRADSEVPALSLQN